jgi:DNA-binding NarL/FixJ family response regulator
MTGVLVVEDQQVLASALAIAINAQPDLECIAAVSTVETALETMAVQVPDVVLMDVQLPGTDGIEGTRLIKEAYPEVSVLILTAGATPERLAAATAAGAAGFLAKDSSFADILAVIRSPAQGTMTIQGTALKGLLDERRTDRDRTWQGGAELAEGTPRGHEPEGTRLTTREREVLDLMAEGLDSRAIADFLVVSLHTVRGHIKNIMMKLGAHTQLEAVVMANRAGLLHREAQPSSPSGA